MIQPRPLPSLKPVTVDSTLANRFVQARNYRRRTDARAVDVVVMHDEEAVESDKTALNVALWFSGTSAPEASSHYTVDRAEVIQCVRETDDAWHACAPVNEYSIGIEMSGYAKQSEADWLADMPMLTKAAELVADICQRHDVPVGFVDAAGLLRGDRGVTTHVEITNAWHKTTHQDPGPHFPMEHFLDLVNDVVAGASAPDIAL